MRLSAERGPTLTRRAHFDLYLRAMHEAGSDSLTVEKALASVRIGGSTSTATLISAGVPAGAAAFSGKTFALAANGKSHEVAAAFTFGREDLIPVMFTELVMRLSREYPGKLDTFRYYLEHHIEVDGGHHGAICLRHHWSSCFVAMMTASGLRQLRLPSQLSSLASPCGIQLSENWVVMLKDAFRLTLSHAGSKWCSDTPFSRQASVRTWT